MDGKTVYEVSLVKQCEKGADSVRRVRGFAESSFAAADAAMGLCAKEERVYQVKRLFSMAFEA